MIATSREILLDFERGDLEKCVAQIESLPDGIDGRPELLAVSAIALARLGREDQALPLFRRLVEREPDDPAHYCNLSTCLYTLRDTAGSISAAEQGLKLAPADPGLLVALAQALYDRGDYRAALSHLERIPPNLHSVESVIALGFVFFQLDRVDDAKNALHFVLNRGGVSDNELVSIGVLANSLQLYDLSEKLFRQAMEREATRHVAAAHLICQYERQNRLEAARGLLEDCAPLGGDDLTLARARVLARGGDTREAIALYQSLLIDDRLTCSSRHSLYFDLGKLLDKCGRYAEAFSAFEFGHRIAVELLHTNHPDLLAEKSPEDWDVSVDDQQAIERLATKAPRASCRVAPIFVIGFPRSGTTLLEQVLGSHPNLVTLDEVVAVDRAIHELNVLGQRYPHCLADLDEALLARAERAYWHEVEKHFSGDFSRRIVDKYPFNLVRLPMILSLFPGAKIIMMLRHPLDCVLSCYMQKFKLNKGTPMWATLESTSVLYGRAMGAYLRHRDALSASVLEIRYEDLVRDFDGNVSKILDYIGEPWDDRVHDFSKTAVSRGRISTPSYAQVTRPIYSDSISRWRHYREQLDAAAPLMSQFIDAFGYDR